MFAGDAEVITFWVEAPEGETEAVLAAGGAVAAITFGLHENGHDVVSEGDGGDGVGFLDFDWELDGFALPLDLESGFAVGDGGYGAPLDCGFRCVDDGKFCFRGDVALNTVCFGGSDNERLFIVFKGEVDLFRVDLELGCESTDRRESDDRGEEIA